jgi:RNA polymerase sigma-70 factor (ECF subfamily)
MTSSETSLRDEVVKWIPNLRAFALSLTRSSNYDDLVQDTLLKALSNLDKFQPGTNMRAWLFTILRHNFYNEIRYQKYHQTGPLEDVDSARLETAASQEKYIEFQDVLHGLGVLLPEQREALILIAVEGLSYEETAAICGCPIGTVKSRLSRARHRLESHLNGTPAEQASSHLKASIRPDRPRAARAAGGGDGSSGLDLESSGPGETLLTAGHAGAR